MHTTEFIFQLFSLTIMATLCCSRDVYVSTKNQTWFASNQDTICNLAKSSDNLTLNHTILHGPTIVWVDETMCSNRSVWINMTGCFNLTLTSIRNRSIHIPAESNEDPVVFCLQKCNSVKVFLSATECYCSEFYNVARDPQCHGRICGRFSDRLCGSNEKTLKNDTRCVCGYEKTKISTNKSGDCMSTKLSQGKLVNEVRNCGQEMPVLCAYNQNKYTVPTDHKTNWTGALIHCQQDSHFIGVKNGSDATFNENATVWVGLFSVELTKVICMALNVTNHTLIQQNCSQLLPSLCYNQTANNSSNQTSDLTTMPVETSHITTDSFVTGYPSTSTTAIQTHTCSFPKEQAITSSSATSSSPDEVVTQPTTKCENPSYSSGSVDQSTTTTTLTTVSKGKGQPKENTNRKSPSEFPTLAVGFGTGGAVVLILILSIVVVFYRRRKQNRSNKEVSKLYDGHPHNTQHITSKTKVKNGNDRTEENRIVSNVLSDDVEERAGLGDYDHLAAHKNRKLTRRPGEAFYNSTYDHVGSHDQLVSSNQDESAYSSFSQKNESVLFSGVEYDHIVRNTDMYDHMRTGSFTTVEDSNYDHTGSGEHLRSGTGSHDKGNTPSKNGNTLHDHRSRYGNYGNEGGNGQWHILNSGGPRNDQEKNSTEAQYDHLPKPRVKRDISQSHEGDYDHTFMVDEYDHIGSVDKRCVGSIVQEDEYDHVTEL